VRQLWWRITTPLDGPAWLDACAAVYVTDIYGIDPVLAVHGHSMIDRSHRTATTDSSIWFHRPIHAEQWNLLESRSPAAARGRGLVSLNLYDADRILTATLIQEGLAIVRS
jgi:acyl-CoA thioesterase-2